MQNETVQPAGNYYDKYNTRNPIARHLMQGFLAAFDDCTAMASDAADVLEIGCGEGELSIRLARAGRRVRGCDIAPDVVEEAMKRATAAGFDIPFSVCAVEDAEGRFEPASLVVCCEVLEHVDDPVAALRALCSLSSRWLLVSVPREPVWRALNLARLRYVAQLGNTPGHVQHWSRKAFVDLLSQHVEVVAVKSPLPWTMALCRVR